MSSEYPLQELNRLEDKINSSLEHFIKLVETSGFSKDSPGLPGVFYEEFYQTASKLNDDEHHKRVPWQILRGIAAEIYTEYKKPQISLLLIDNAMKSGVKPPEDMYDILQTDKTRLKFHIDLKELENYIKSNDIDNAEKLAKELRDKEEDPENVEELNGILENIRIERQNEKKMRKGVFILSGALLIIIVMITIGISIFKDNTSNQENATIPGINITTNNSIPPAINKRGELTLAETRWCRKQYKILEAVSNRNLNNEQTVGYEQSVSDYISRCNNAIMLPLQLSTVEEEIKNMDLSSEIEIFISQL